MPGNAQQVWRFGAFDFKDWLGGGKYAQITAAVEFEAIAVDQVMRPRQVEEIGLARIGDQANATAMSVDIGEGYGVDRSVFRPTSPGEPQSPAAYSDETVRQ